uniref:CLTH domain-containing protein n=1 Tax=Rhabditophanes sp. KR3021 TaxID=114890 RepID=A0AC35UBB0_9BILA
MDENNLSLLGKLDTLYETLKAGFDQESNLLAEQMPQIVVNEENAEKPDNWDEINQYLENEVELKGSDIPRAADYIQITPYIEALKAKNVLPLIEWVSTNTPEDKRLLRDLHIQNVIKLLQEGSKAEAIAFTQTMGHLYCIKKNEKLHHLMGTIGSYPDKFPYKEFFLNDNWIILKNNFITAFIKHYNPLKEILTAGSKSAPKLIGLKQIMTSRNHIFDSDELPIETMGIENPTHSSFMCPILKVMSTESNPPVRLLCGHVVCKNALDKLEHIARQPMVKCPYCPLQSSVDDTVEIHF